MYATDVPVHAFQDPTLEFPTHIDVVETDGRVTRTPVRILRAFKDENGKVIAYQLDPRDVQSPDGVQSGASAFHQLLGAAKGRLPESEKNNVRQQSLAYYRECDLYISPKGGVGVAIGAKGLDFGSEVEVPPNFGVSSSLFNDKREGGGLAAKLQALTLQEGASNSVSYESFLASYYRESMPREVTGGVPLSGIRDRPPRNPDANEKRMYPEDLIRVGQIQHPRWTGSTRRFDNVVRYVDDGTPVMVGDQPLLWNRYFNGKPAPVRSNDNGDISSTISRRNHPNLPFPIADYPIFSTDLLEAKFRLMSLRRATGEPSVFDSQDMAQLDDWLTPENVRAGMNLRTMGPAEVQLRNYAMTDPGDTPYSVPDWTSARGFSSGAFVDVRMREMAPPALSIPLVSHAVRVSRVPTPQPPRPATTLEINGRRVDFTVRDDLGNAYLGPDDKPVNWPFQPRLGEEDRVVRDPAGNALIKKKDGTVQMWIDPPQKPPKAG